MGLVIRHLKVLVEPAGAAGLAGVLSDVLAGDRFRGRRVGVLLSGSNTGMERVREALDLSSQGS
jgi:threonine dehydratase